MTQNKSNLDEVVDYKVYKEAPYPNSDQERLGLTLKGNSKDFIDAQQNVKDIVVKGKQYDFSDGYMRILDVRDIKGMINAVVEVCDTTVSRANVELKVYAPRKNKRKGATIEIRKLSESDFSHVQCLSNMLKIFLDGFIDGEKVADILKSDSKGAKKSKVTSKPTLFSCDVCNFQSKFKSGLRTHISKIHSQSVPNFKCQNCDHSSLSEEDLQSHINMSHTSKHKRSQESVSPASSPPHKRQELQENKVTDVSSKDGIADFDSNKIAVSDDRSQIPDVSVSLIMMLHNKIEELENRIFKLEHEKIVNTIAQVHDEHLPMLRGYKLRFVTKPDGACFDSAAAVHIFGNPDENIKVKRMLNCHIADNWDIYSDYIPLPFKETVGVGKNATQTNITTKEEMLSFLRSDKSLKLFADNQQIQALANLFNINIQIFSYDSKSVNWSEIVPNPSLVNTSEVSSGDSIPDMALYHSKDDHFDLLVKDDCKISSLGMHSKASHESLAVSNHDAKKSIDIEEGKDENHESYVSVEAMDVENDSICIDKIDFECRKCRLSFQSQEALTLHINTHETVLFKCIQCDACFETKQVLENHTESVHERKLAEKWNCNNCDDVFETKAYLEDHIKSVHIVDSVESSEQWNCDNCDFQANEANILMKHLKLSGHLPSIQASKKDKNNDSRECYTCKKKFSGYYDLMNHRKLVHPSSKKCRNFPGDCKFKSDCWYVHDDAMDVDEDWSFKCNSCDEKFKDKDTFKKHNDDHHVQNVIICENYLKGKCEKSQTTCEYQHMYFHNSKVDSQSEVFHKVSKTPAPPDQMSKILQFMTTIDARFTKMEENFQKLVV